MNEATHPRFSDADWEQAGLFDDQLAKQSLDELFRLTQQYRSSEAYHRLLQFVGRFRSYSPFNALLVHIQMPGATYVAPPRRWLRDFQHRIRPGARPLVILRPMGPVMFVFDASDTEPQDGARPLPREVVNPFEVRGGKVGNQLTNTIDSAKRDGVRTSSRDAGTQSAGEIQFKPGGSQDVVVGSVPTPQTVTVPVRYEILLNSRHSREAQYATLVHELGHLYCGRLGTPNPKWWPDRQGFDSRIREFEAESVCFLVCRRFGIDNPSDEYLSGYVNDNKEVPPISLEAVMAASGLIERMGRQRLKPRKEGHSNVS
jgi:hypothetical protein